MTDPEDDEELDELDEDLFDVWTRPDPLGTSTAHTRLDEWVDDDEAAPAALQRESDTLASEVQEAAARHAADPNADYHGLLAETENAADTVDGLAVVAGQLYVQFMTVRRGWMDYAETAAGDVVQSVQTTLGAIGLLLRNGYALDAEARWRGLHELACTAALLATDTDPPGICMRYLAHGQRLLVDDPAYQQPWVRDRRFFGWNYEWLRQSHHIVDKRGRPLRFTQRWLFDNAALTSAPFALWLQPSHDPVHLSSRAVAEGSEQAGAAPAGYSRERTTQVAWQVACSFYELVGYLLLLPHEEGLSVARRRAWLSLVRERVVPIRPSPMMERIPTPAEQLGLL